MKIQITLKSLLMFSQLSKVEKHLIKTSKAFNSLTVSKKQAHVPHGELNYVCWFSLTFLLCISTVQLVVLKKANKTYYVDSF